MVCAFYACRSASLLFDNEYLFIVEWPVRSGITAGTFFNQKKNNYETNYNHNRSPAIMPNSIIRN